MKHQLAYNMECNAFSARVEEDIAVLQFKDNFLLRTTDLSVRDTILDYLEMISKSPTVKTAILMGAPEKRGCDEYFDFYRNVINSELGDSAVQRMYNVINQLVVKIIGLDKIVIHANSGKIISSFLNISLACDYRIISDDAVFQNPCLALGLVPKGGGAYFLPRIVGLNKSYEILLSEAEITAREALSLGIVNQVVPGASLMTAAMEKAREFGRKPLTSLTAIKRLLNYSLNDIRAYLEYENQILSRVIMASDEWKKA